MRNNYMVQNGAMPTTARIPLVTTGTSIKTMLQIKPATPIVIIAWGFSFDIIPTALVSVELLTTGTVGVAALTDFVAADITKWDGGATTSAISLAAEASGYTSSSTEGTITATRVLDYQPTWAQSYSTQFPLGREPGMDANDFLRIRVTTATAINMNCWISWEE